jgi:hypothetical protein
MSTHSGKRERSQGMEGFGQILDAVPHGITGMVLVFVMVSGLVLWFLVPLMIYSICRRIKTIEWNINYFLFGERGNNARTVKTDRDSLVYWILAIVEERQREKARQAERRRQRIQPLDHKSTEMRRMG